MASCWSTTSTAPQGDCPSIAALHKDIIETHVLTKLDGPTLASAACASPMLHALCTQEKLWRDLCISTWSSINDPRVRHVISTFSAGYRSFFSDSYPTTFQYHPQTTQQQQHHHLPSRTSELISAVDILYEKKLVCSKVEVTKTVTDAFLGPPLWIDLLDRKEAVPVKFESDNDDFLSHLEQSMSLSWIVIDPTRKRSVNVSSIWPVSVRRHSSMAAEVQLLYVTILPGDDRVGYSDPVQCRIEVTCRGEEGGEMHVREVNMQVQDMDGINLSGEGSLVILQEAMGSERRKQEKGRESYEEFMEMERERRERNKGREKQFDVVFFTIIRVVILLGLLCGLFVY